ncbi:hypothetical protein H310_05220 [Aphanomyces invadans]|uniref:Reverse transcriptase zinc-binding domain-containing protein n=1 Tax=Aphanomyces invadans TaxID=157072 RepID=A0A024UBW6_9STRA|nr:hypothetical protein H310_05220 [Aphanomyces invadans]ETW03876.1 hypothetical protein H310_05220 [Aphanomyces invadans]|eukprot:XP_008868105.1 hypothetical protein H310_05220 [Aphanomyces invadans]
MQYLLQYREPQFKCNYCGANETYQHFLFECRFSQEVWTPFGSIHRLLSCAVPVNAKELVFDVPKPRYGIWLQRNDRTFRPDLPNKTSMELAVQVAHLIKLHLSQLLQDLPIKKSYSKVFNTLRVLSTDVCLRQYLVPNAITDS